MTGPTNRVFGYNVVRYDGHNASSIVEALGFQRGDGVVVIPGSQPLVIRAATLQEIRETAPESAEDRT